MERKTDDEIASRVVAHMVDLLPDLICEQPQWADETFEQSTPASITAHLKREFVELLEAMGYHASADSLRSIGLPHDNESPDPESVVEEAADMMLLLNHLCSKFNRCLLIEAQRKFHECLNREWGEPDAEGVVEHIR